MLQLRIELGTQLVITVVVDVCIDILLILICLYYRTFVSYAIKHMIRYVHLGIISVEGLFIGSVKIPVCKHRDSNSYPMYCWVMP